MSGGNKVDENPVSDHAVLLNIYQELAKIRETSGDVKARITNLEASDGRFEGYFKDLGARLGHLEKQGAANKVKWGLVTVACSLGLSLGANVLVFGDDHQEIRSLPPKSEKAMSKVPGIKDDEDTE